MNNNEKLSKEKCSSSLLIAEDSGNKDVDTSSPKNISEIQETKFSVDNDLSENIAQFSDAEEEIHNTLYKEFFPEGYNPKNESYENAKSSGNIIRIRNLTKDYKVGWAQNKKFRALDNISFDVKAGGIFGFLGPNGAGKTTTIKILLGITKPTSGTVEIFGEKMSTKDVRRHIGYFPEISYYHKYLTAEEAILYYGRLCGLSGKIFKERTKSLLETTGLYEHRKKLLKTFSKGMLQRVGLAQALVNDPALLIMDEPTSGLDPLMKKEMRDIILYLNSEGRTIFFSSHELSEVEMICNRVIILNNGKVAAEGSLNEILPSNPDITIVTSYLPRNVEEEFLKNGINLINDDSTVNIKCTDLKLLCKAFQILAKNHCEIIEVKKTRQTLEDFFVKTLCNKKVGCQ